MRLVLRLLPPHPPVPSWGRVFAVVFLLSGLVFGRPPSTNFVFDEQEAILANPYLGQESGLELWDVLSVDFWGRGPGRTIGSYRPLPNLLWRLLAPITTDNSPFSLLLLNWVVHALTAATAVSVFSLLILRGKTGPLENSLGWFGALWLATCALSTEAVCSAVGVADLLVGFFTAATMLVIVTRVRSTSLTREKALSLTWLRDASSGMGLLVVCLLLGCFSKESMVGTLAFAVPFTIYAARDRGFSPVSRVVLGGVTLALSACALLTYVCVRNSFFPTTSEDPAAFVGDSPFAALVEPAFLAFGSPPLPEDPINNPLFGVAFDQRLATVARIFSGLMGRVFLPLQLVADSSYPRLLPHSLSWSASVGVVLALGLVFVWGASWGRFATLSSAARASGIFALGALLGYLPVSNTLVLLPTIRAERLFYTPTLLVVLMVLALLYATLNRRDERGPNARMRFLSVLGLGFILLHSFRARRHAADYADDLSFWRASEAIRPPSAKSSLNLGIMLGARGDLDARLRLSRQAAQLAPQWPMAQVYWGDAHCRRDELEEAQIPYLDGLRLAPNSKALSALALQCIWEHGAFPSYLPQMRAIAEQAPGSWLDYFLHQLQASGEREGGIEKQYRPRKYNQRSSR